MNKRDLKECPSCMSDAGFKRISTVEQTEFTKWGETATFVYTGKVLERYLDHCMCCGQIVDEELMELEKIQYIWIYVGINL